MNNSHALSSQMAARTMAALLMLGLAVPGVFAADQHRSSDQAGNAAASGSTSVNRELQRLFNQSGQQMPSMRTADLPYATTPQMHRVRKQTAEPADPKKKKMVLFSKVFGRFRRDKSVEEVATPEPPPIVMGDRQLINRRKDGSVANNRTPQEPHNVANHQSQSLQQPQQDSAQPVQNRRTVRQVSQPQNVAAEQAGSHISRVDMASQDELVNPFEDGSVFGEGKSGLEWYAIGEIPDVAGKAFFSSTDSFGGAIAKSSESVEPEEAALNLFSGLQIAADDEFKSWFEESIIDPDANESLEQDEAPGLIPQTAPAVSKVDDSGFAEYYELLELSEKVKTDSVSVEVQESTDFDSGWQAHLMSDELPSIKRTNEFAPEEQQTVDLPYATTPQMHRVRKRAAEPAAPKKKKMGLLSKVFGRFRRDKSAEEAATPEPPPIVMSNRQSIGRRKDGSAGNNRTSQEPRDIANHPSQLLKQSQQDSSQSVQNRRTVRPVSQPLNVTAEQAGSRIPRVDMASQDEFVTPSGDGAAIGEIPEMAETVVFSPTDSRTVASESVDPEEAALNPFSGLQLTADDEVQSRFEESIVDVHTNESPESDAVAALKTDSTVSEVIELGFPEYYDLLLSEESEINSVSVETQRLTGFDSALQARLMSDELPSIERMNEFAPGERRLARSDRVPAQRQEAQRWRQVSDAGGAVEQRTEKWSLSEHVTVNPASAAPKVSRQQTRRQKIESRRHLTGFMGFCPFTLREDRELADVSEEHEARFGLNTYHFSSAEACERFKANPTRYAPAAGGADVVALVNSGEQHAGSLEFAMWYRDRLYLFCSQETAGLFRADPASFGDQY